MQYDRLWIDHVHYTFQVVSGIFRNDPFTTLYLNRLIQNQSDMAEAIDNQHPGTKETVKGLLVEHISIAGDIIKAVAGGDITTAKEKKVVWYRNGKEIAQGLSKIFGIDYESLKHHMDQHLLLLWNYIFCFSKGEGEKVIMYYDKGVQVVREMASVMSATY